MGINTAEIYGVDEDWAFILATEKDTGKYGRWPGRILSKSTGSVFNEEIVDEFPAVAS